MGGLVVQLKHLILDRSLRGVSPRLTFLIHNSLPVKLTIRCESAKAIKKSDKQNHTVIGLPLKNARLTNFPCHQLGNTKNPKTLASAQKDTAIRQFYSTTNIKDAFRSHKRLILCEHIGGNKRTYFVYPKNPRCTQLALCKDGDCLTFIWMKIKTTPEKTSTTSTNKYYTSHVHITG